MATRAPQSFKMKSWSSLRRAMLMGTAIAPSEMMATNEAMNSGESCSELEYRVMRKRTLAGVCTILAFAILFGLRWVRVYFPLGLSPFFVFLVLMPLLMIPATFLNKRLLAWRKSRGRDIAEEEKY